MTAFKFDTRSKAISMDSGLAGVEAQHSDMDAGACYLLRGTDIVGIAAGPERSGRWRSGIARVAAGVDGFAWARIKGRLREGAVLRLFGDGQLVYTTPVLTSQEPVRLPAIQARSWAVEVESADRITRVTLAGSTGELL